MSRFYFNFRNSQGLTRDEVGVEFGSVSAARSAALVALGEAAREVTLSGQAGPIAIDVTDEAGLLLLSALALIELEEQFGPRST